MQSATRILLVIGLMLTGYSAVFAADEESNQTLSIWQQGRFYIDARYRVESVSQDGFVEDALASTLRTRTGFQSGEYHGWSGLIEFEDIRIIGIDDFNSTANSRPNFRLLLIRRIPS